MPISFKEEQFQNMYHDVRVFCNGVDLTPYLAGSISVAWADRNGRNTCSFKLNNAFNNFVLTEKNMLNKWRQSTGSPLDIRYSEQAKFLIYNYKKNKQQNIVDPITHEQRWPLRVNAAIFHKHDPVRVFIHNPFSSRDEWMPFFTGFIDTYAFTTNYINGLSEMDIKAEDIRMLLGKMRVNINGFANIITLGADAIRGQTVIFDNPNAGLFQDLIVKGNGTTHNFSNKSLEIALSELITGSESGLVTTPQGVGRYTRGVTQVFDTTGKDEAKKQILNDWYLLGMFGQNGPDKVDGVQGNVRDRWFTEQEVLYIGLQTTWDSVDNDVPGLGGPSAPIGGRLHFLLPPKGTGATNLTEFSQSNSHQSVEWVTRLSIIQDFIQRIDYQMWVSPMGDIMVEFPMYDFLPEDFGAEVSRILTVDQHVIDDHVDDEGGEMVSAVVVAGSPGQQELHERGVNVGDKDGLPTTTVRVVQSSILASRIGAVTDSALTLPFFAGSNVNPKILDMWALLEFNKRMAMANNLEIHHVYRPFIFPNRPLLHMTRDRMGIMTSVQHNIEIFGAPTTSVNLKYVRTKDSESGQFRFVTGGHETPISFRTPFTLDNFSKKSGVAASKSKGGHTKPAASKTGINPPTVPAVPTIKSPIG